MHGHIPLIDMRKRGAKPSGIVFIDDLPNPIAKDWHNPGEFRGESWLPDQPTICTHGDVIQMLDMRFLVGLTVSISSHSEIRAKSLFAKAKICGAAIVAATHSIELPMPFGQTSVRSGWTEVWRKSKETEKI